ncbi:MAG: hypothetical protein AAGC74_03085 [Verrucomicrobiota bacterium]
MKRFYQLLVLALLTMAQVASAHPGPPGHTHDDEWPFGELLVGFAVLTFVVGAVFYFAKQNRLEGAEVRQEAK